MTTTAPVCNPAGRYEARQAAAILGVSTDTLYRYTAAGYLHPTTRKANGRQTWTGAELTRCWYIVY